MNCGVNITYFYFLFILVLFIKYIKGQKLPEQHIRQIVQGKRIYEYEKYSDVEIYHFTISSSALEASWFFKANGSHCSDETIMLYLQHGAYPVINPNGWKFPDKFLLNSTQLYHTSILPNLEQVSLNVTFPYPGDWFLIAYIPSFSNRIFQKGLFFSCKSWLTTYVNVTFLTYLEILTPGTTHKISSFPAHFRFYVPHGIQYSSLHFEGCERLNFGRRTGALPITMEEVDCGNHTLRVASETWTYISLDSSIDALDILLELSYDCMEENCTKPIYLERTELKDMFEFEFNQPFDVEYNANPITLNVWTNETKVLAFKILPILDIGGILTVRLTYIYPNSNGSSIEGCLWHYTKESGKCDWHLQVNSSDWRTQVYIPFPLPGYWYLKLTSTCYEDSYCDSNSSIMLVDIKSDTCYMKDCGFYGKCERHASSYFLFGMCTCYAGYQGWGCTDDSNALSKTSIILSMVFLITSNLGFFAVVIVSFRRKLYVLAVSFSATMLSSMLYHACDSEAHRICILKLSELQFADFFCAILSIWLILITIADVPTALSTPCYIMGAIGIAVGVNINKQGLYVFVVPVGIAVIIIMFSWLIINRLKRSCHYPPRTRVLRKIFPAVIIVTIALIIYTTLQTKQNYWYLHSLWHILMAIASLFLLPSKPVKPEGSDVSGFLQDTDL